MMVVAEIGEHLARDHEAGRAVRELGARLRQRQAEVAHPRQQLFARHWPRSRQIESSRARASRPETRSTSDRPSSSTSDPRSEERRVGKEGRSRWAAHHCTKKTPAYVPAVEQMVLDDLG